VLAAVIMMAVIGLINVKGFMHAYRAQKYDGIIAIISFVCTLAFAPHLDKGIMIGVVLSLAHYLYRNTKPVVAVLARHPDGSLRDARRHHLKQCEHIAVIRFEGPLFFANVSYLDDQITDRIQQMPHLRHILLACQGFNEVDASGEEMLSLQIDKIREAGMDISFSDVNESVLDLFKRTHLYEKIGEDHLFATSQEAINAIYNRAHEGSQEAECPLMSVCYMDLERIEPGKPVVTDFRTLIVDDEVEFIHSLSKRLQRKGLEVDTSSDPIEALEKMEARFYEVVVMDVRMPKMSGKDLLVEVHSRWPETTIIMLTGHASSHDAFEMAKIGAYEYLIKPCTVDELLAVMNKALIEKRTAICNGNLLT
jgi:ActR/RegA family two-component response regulator/anti-anti-sigma regulatory factor